MIHKAFWIWLFDTLRYIKCPCKIKVIGSPSSPDCRVTSFITCRKSRDHWFSEFSRLQSHKLWILPKSRSSAFRILPIAESQSLELAEQSQGHRFPEFSRLQSHKVWNLPNKAKVKERRGSSGFWTDLRVIPVIC